MAERVAEGNSTAPGRAARREGYRVGVLMLLVSTAAWSTAGFFARLVETDPWTMLFWRGIFGALGMLAVILWQERSRAWAAFAGMGSIGILYCSVSAASMLAFIPALKLTTVAHVAVIYATAPFMTAGLAWLALREPMSRPTALASAAALLGVIVMMGLGPGEGTWLGDFLAVLMALGMAVMAVIGRWARDVPQMPAACLSALIAALVCVAAGAPASVTGPQLFYLALFGLVNSAVGLTLFTFGARLVPAAETALIGALEVPFAPLWVWLAFGEAPGAATLAGGAIVLCAVLAHIRVAGRGRPA